VKLSIAMVAEALSGADIRCSFHDCDWLLNLERYALYNGELDLKANTLYILSSAYQSYQPRLLNAERGAAILFYEDSFDIDPELFPRASCLQICRASLSLAELMNRIIACFERYARLDQMMRDVVQSRDSVQKLIELSAGLFTNEVTVRNRQHRYVAQSYGKMRYFEPEWGIVDEEGFSSKDLMQHLRSSRDYKESVRSEEPWYYDDDFAGFRMLCVDIFIQESFVYRIKVIATHHPFRPYDAALLKYVAGLIREKQLRYISEEDDNDIRGLFISALETDNGVSEKGMRLVMRHLDFDLPDRYQLLCIESGVNTSDVLAYPYCCMRLNQLLGAACSFLYKNRIVSVVDLSKCPLRGDAFRQALAAFLRDENLRTGVSLEFPGDRLTQLAVYYRQAELALSLGGEYRPEHWIHNFADYRCHYLLRRLREDFEGEFFVPGLHSLLEYDRKNNTDYFLTLEAYVRSRCSATQTAQLLNIHRTTLTYRLEKIRTLLSFDIDSPESYPLLALMMEFHRLAPDYL